MRWEPPGGDQTEPTEGKKDDGWPVDALVPSTELNWQWAKRYDFINWLQQVAIREFSTLEEAIAATSVPDTFRVHAPEAGNEARAATAFNRSGSGSGSVIDLVADGERIYYAQAGEVYAANPADGTDHGDWSTNPYDPALAGNVTALACDGRYLYICYIYNATASWHEVHTVNLATGVGLASTDQIGTSDYIAARANGAYFVALSSSKIIVYSVGAVGVLTYQGTSDHGAALAAVAIDDMYAYIGGTQGTGSFDVRRVKLSDQVASWSIALPTTSAPSINAIWTDGDLIYVATDLVTTTAAWGSVSASIFALNKLTGATVWVNSSLATDIDWLAGDDRWLYATTAPAGYDCYALDKWTGIPVWLAPDTVALIADGISVIGHDGSTEFRRVWRGAPTRIYQRADGEDVNRRPFFNLAIPMGGRL